MKTALLLVEAFTALFFIGLSLPLIYRKAGPNGWYGVRVRKTLTDERVWYEANASFGKDLLIASLTVLALCAGMFYLKDGMTLNTFLILVSTVPMVPYVAATVKCFIDLGKFQA